MLTELASATGIHRHFKHSSHLTQALSGGKHCSLTPADTMPTLATSSDTLMLPDSFFSISSAMWFPTESVQEEIRKILDLVYQRNIYSVRKNNENSNMKIY